jgi:hypothetical protein
MMKGNYNIPSNACEKHSALHVDIFKTECNAKSESEIMFDSALTAQIQVYTFIVTRQNLTQDSTSRNRNVQ